jgi:hypothetical protein
MQSFGVLKRVVHIVTTGLYDEELHTFITSALHVGEWSYSRSDRFTQEERVPGTQIAAWVGPRASLDAVKKIKIFRPKLSRLATRIIIIIGNSKVVPVLNQLSTAPWRRMGEWMYRSTFS